MGSFFANESHTLGGMLDGLRTSLVCWKLKKSCAERRWSGAPFLAPSDLTYLHHVLFSSKGCLRQPSRVLHAPVDLVWRWEGSFGTETSLCCACSKNYPCSCLECLSSTAAPPPFRFVGAAGSPPQKWHLLMGAFSATDSHTLAGMLNAMRASFARLKMKKSFAERG